MTDYSGRRVADKGFVENPTEKPLLPVQGVYSEAEPLGPMGRRIAASDNATSILERARILRGLSIASAARISGLSEARYRAAESMTAVNLTASEKTGLQKLAPGMSAAALVAPNSPENRAKQAGRF